MNPQPVLHQLSELKVSVTGAGGDDIPYLGYIEVDIQLPQINDNVYTVPVLIVYNTDYNLTVPVLIGTNVIKMLDNVEHDSLPSEWKAALLSITANLGTVKSTNKHDIYIQPNETLALSGFVRKTTDHETALTEPTDNTSSRIGVCPRLVNLNQPGKSARVPVRIFNMSAKVLTIQPNTPLCELREAKALRNWTPENNSHQIKERKKMKNQRKRILLKNSKLI